MERKRNGREEPDEVRIFLASPNVITYTEGVNSKAFARVNFNDDLSKTVYAALYAKIGDSLSFPR